MIKSLQITGIHAKHDQEIDAYVRQKIGECDRYIPKKARESTKAEVKLKQEKSKDNAKFICEVIVHLPNGSITVHEKAITMLAAIDLAEDKLKIQLKKYKDKHSASKIHRRLANKFLRSRK